MLASALPGSICLSSSLPLLIVLSVTLATLAIYQELNSPKISSLKSLYIYFTLFSARDSFPLLPEKSFMCCFSSFWSQFMLLSQSDFAQPPSPKQEFFYYPESVFLHHSILFISFITSQSIYVFVYFCIFLPGDCEEG